MRLTSCLSKGGLWKARQSGLPQGAESIFLNFCYLCLHLQRFLPTTLSRREEICWGWGQWLGLTQNWFPCVDTGHIPTHSGALDKLMELRGTVCAPHTTGPQEMVLQTRLLCAAETHWVVAQGSWN